MNKFGPVRLMPGVTRGHVAAYLWAAFVSIGIFTYATALQPYLLEVNIGVPPGERGVVSGNLQFWQEIVTLLFVGLFGAWSDRVGRRVVYIVGFLITGLAYAAYPFADDIGQLLIYRLIYAVGIAALGGMLATVLADYPIDADRGKLTGISFFLNAVGALLFFAVLTRLPALYQGFGATETDAGRFAYLTIAAVSLLKEAGRADFLQDLLERCRTLEKEGKLQEENVVRQLYKQFTTEQITGKIAALITPPELNIPVEVIFQRIEDLHASCPNNLGDWYFTGNYPTPGGNRVVNKAFMNYMEGKNVRGY